MAQAKVQSNDNHPFQIIFCGAIQSGKTSLSKALQGKDLAGTTHSHGVSMDDPIIDGSKFKFVDYAYESVAPFLREDFIRKSQICVVCIDRENSNSFNTAKSAIEEIRKLDPDQKIPIVIALTKEDQNQKKPDYDILVKDRELNKLTADYGLIGCIKTSAEQGDITELRDALLNLRREVILNKEKEIPQISAVEEHVPVSENLKKQIKRIDNLSKLLEEAKAELEKNQRELVKGNPNVDSLRSLDQSITHVSDFLKKLSEIKQIPDQMKNKSDVDKTKHMHEAYEVAFENFSQHVKSDILTINPPQGVKKFFARLFRSLTIGKLYTDTEKLEIDRVKHQTDFKKRLQIVEGRAEGGLKKKNTDPDDKDKSLGPTVHPE